MAKNNNSTSSIDRNNPVASQNGLGCPGAMVVTLVVSWWGGVYIYAIVQGKHHIVAPKGDPL